MSETIIKNTGQTLEEKTGGKETKAPLNWAILWPGKVYRSGLPVTTAEWLWLKSQGIKGVLSFCSSVDDPPELRKMAGVTHYLNLRVPDCAVPEDRQIEEALAFVLDPAHQPVLFHCRYGMGRTGLLAAVLRMRHEGWSARQALAEGATFGVMSQAQIEWVQAHAPKFGY